MNFNCRLA